MKKSFLRMFKWSLWTCLCVMLTATLVYAARPAPLPSGAGTLTGKVTIAGSRTAIVGATVTAVGSAGTYTAITNSKGSYSMTPQAGDYNVTATASGYNSQSFTATVREGASTVLNFGLSASVSTNGTLTGTIIDATTGAPIAEVLVATDHGDFSDTTDASGNYEILDVAAGSYDLSAAADGYQTSVEAVSVTADQTTTTDFALLPVVAGLSITSLTATPDTFVEASVPSITLSAVVDGAPATYTWTQVSGPKVPLAATDATATLDTSALEIAAECELVFELTVTDGTASASAQISVAATPTDIVQYPGPNVQIGGASTAVARFQYGGAEWCLFNLGTALRATTVGMTAGATYEVTLPAFATDIEIVSYGGQVYALVAAGGAGICVVDITDPTAMVLQNILPVNYIIEGVTYTETGGSILPDNVFSSLSSTIASLVSDGTDLYIANHDFGLQKTSLVNVFGDVREEDGTLQIDQELCTVQYAGEKAWGGPVDLSIVNGKLFCGLGALGIAIFDPASLTQIGRYNLYTDEARTEDYFGAMAITQAVSSDPVSGDLFLDDFTGMPDYRQVNYEITVVMKGTGTGEPTPWADMERDGKWYYEAIGVDVAQQGDRTIAYAAYSLGGVIAVDVTGFETATASDMLEGTFLGFFPAVMANGPYDTLSDSSSLLPYEGAGMLKESGVTGVKVRGELVYLTDHFAGLVILENAANPELWHGPLDSYDNDTDGIPNNNVPETEDITSYDMSAWDPLDNESLPWAFYQSPCLLATRELKGHGYTLDMMDDINVTLPGQIDVLECSGAGGFVMVDVVDIDAELMADRFTISVYIPTTDEIGAAADGSATQTIAVGHAAGLDITDNYLYLSDGPHGISAWQITDAAGYPTDTVKLVANTLQDEYPELVNGELIYPASHTVRNVIDPSGQYTWALCVGNGMRRVPIGAVESGVGQVGAPLLIKLFLEDSFEHNADWGVVKAFNFQDQAYDVEFVGNYAYVADGSNGLTIYDVTKDPTKANSGFFVGNIGYAQADPLLGTASGIELWVDPASGKRYAAIACGPTGVGIVDVTDINNMQIIKVFEPIKFENGELGVADGQAIDVEVIGDKAYFTYDSFGVLCYAMSDLVAPVPDGIDPTDLFKKELEGTVIYDVRPAALAQFKLQYVPGYETVSGGAVKMAYTQVAGKLMLYVAFGEAGVVKIDYTDPAAPVLVEPLLNTAAEASDVAIANGRLYVSDGTGGLVFFK